MPRLFVLSRTFDRIWDCKTYTRELSPFVMDASHGPVKLMFSFDCVVLDALDGNIHPNNDKHECQRQNNKFVHYDVARFCSPHKTFFPKILGKPSCSKPPNNNTSQSREMLKRFSVPSVAPDVKDILTTSSDCSDVIYFVLPARKCMLLVDAHLASCISCELTRSRKFRRLFVRFISRQGGFRNCTPDYEKWTQDERDAWDNYLSVAYMIDVVAVWSWQKIDYAWSKRVLGLHNKQVYLEEGFAWLSTLGGAHSSLGESFLHHAERAGEISWHQLRLAKELGNEVIIARCFLFWAWSLLQRNQLVQCKMFVIKTWKFCGRIRCRDQILENMCRAVWSRLQYKRSLQAKRKKGSKCSRPDSPDPDRESGCSPQYIHGRPAWQSTITASRMALKAF